MQTDAKPKLLSTAYALILSWPEPEEEARRTQQAEQEHPQEQPHE